jgi:hypothetical protein
MVYPMGGPIDGRRGDHVRIAPPLIVTGQDIDTIFGCLGGFGGYSIDRVGLGASEASLEGRT